MRLITLNCPVCGGETELDYDKKNGFCKNCGSKVILDEEIQRIRIDHYVTIENLLILAERAHTKEESYNLYLRALELDPNNLKTVLGLVNSSLTPEKSSYYLKLYFSLLQKEGRKDKQILEEIIKIPTAYPESFATTIIRLNSGDRKFLNAAIDSLFFNFSNSKTKSESIAKLMTSWKLFYRVPPEALIECFLDLIRSRKLIFNEECFRFLRMVERPLSEATLRKFFKVILNMEESDKKSYADFFFSFAAKNNKDPRYLPKAILIFFPKDKDYLELSLSSLEKINPFFVAAEMLLNITEDPFVKKSYLKTIFDILEKNISVKNRLLKTRGFQLFEFLSKNDFMLERDSFSGYYQFLESFIPAEPLPEEKELLAKIFPPHVFSKNKKIAENKKTFLNFFSFFRRHL